MPNKEPYPKPRKIKPQPAKGPRKPRGKMSPEREMPKRNPEAIVPKPAKVPKMDNDLRYMREMPKRIPKAIVPKPAKGIMGSTEVQAQARQQKALEDMRKRMMLRKDKKRK